MSSVTSRKYWTALIVVLASLAFNSVQAQTAFTYQGQLVNQGVPAEGVHDLRFELFDQASDGASQSGFVVVEDVMVSNGLFSTQIDFGAAFDGTPVWLEVSVRPGASSGAFSTLTPRQPITPSPMALDASTLGGMNADTFVSSADLDALLTQIAALQSRIDALENPAVLGRSSQTSNGRFSFGGFNGVRAANAMCQTSFPNEPSAHVCTLDEIQRAVASGNVAASVSDVFAWLVAPVTDGAQFSGMVQNTCQGLTYNSADFARGTRVRVRLGYTSPGNGGGVTGDVVDLQDDIGCGTNLPVLCCS